QHLPRRGDGDRQCAHPPLGRHQELPSRGRSPALLARGHLRREQQPCGDRKAELYAEPGRTPDADKEGSTSPRPAIFQSFPEAGAVGAIALLRGFRSSAAGSTHYAHCRRAILSTASRKDGKGVGPGMHTLLDIPTASLPALWDADFCTGPKRRTEATPTCPVRSTPVLSLPIPIAPRRK